MPGLAERSTTKNVPESLETEYDKGKCYPYWSTPPHATARYSCFSFRLWCTAYTCVLRLLTSACCGASVSPPPTHTTVFCRLRYHIHALFDRAPASCCCCCSSELKSRAFRAPHARRSAIDTTVGVARARLLFVWFSSAGALTFFRQGRPHALSPPASPTAVTGTSPVPSIPSGRRCPWAIQNKPSGSFAGPVSLRCASMPCKGGWHPDDTPRPRPPGIFSFWRSVSTRCFVPPGNALPALTFSLPRYWQHAVLAEVVAAGGDFAPAALAQKHVAVGLVSAADDASS